MNFPVLLLAYVHRELCIRVGTLKLEFRIRILFKAVLQDYSIWWCCVSMKVKHLLFHYQNVEFFIRNIALPILSTIFQFWVKILRETIKHSTLERYSIHQKVLNSEIFSKMAAVLYRFIRLTHSNIFSKKNINYHIQLTRQTNAP